MAYFEGSLKEFNHYIGPLARNVIQQITRSAKRGKCCEKCHRSDVELESAHIHGEQEHGKERTHIIKELLNQHYKVSNDLYKVDLDDFIIKFKKSHLPIEDHFIFLCQQCHDAYDNKKKNVSPLDVQKYIASLSPEEKEKFLKELHLKTI